MACRMHDLVVAAALDVLLTLGGLAGESRFRYRMLATPIALSLVTRPPSPRVHTW